ncbi:MAG: hypothetical protein V4659_04970 [Pseudomonadota bacterium]
MDGDDAADLIGEIERSFAIEFGDYLHHIATVGDIHEFIIRQIDEPSGDACPTSRTFYRLRASLGADGARPGVRLGSIWEGSPRSLRRKLRTEMAWDLPGLTIGWSGCAIMIVSLALAIAVGWGISGLLAVPIVAVGLTALRLDRGAWVDDWATLGSLAQAIAAMNYAALSSSGARQSPATAWRALTTLISGYDIERSRVTPDSQLCN